MLAKLSLDQALIKAKSHANRGEIEEAQKYINQYFNRFLNKQKILNQDYQI